jgi:hypothetical protein
MAGESPLSMMRPAPQRRAKPQQAPRRGRAYRYLPLLLVLVALAAGWTWVWSYAAGSADRTLAGWMEREAAVGRVYSCGTQGVGGFPFSFVSRCEQASASFNSNKPPFDFRAKDITFSAQVFRPTLLNGAITGPVTLADPGQPPIFVADWTTANLSLLGLPPEPERVAVALRGPRLDRVAGPGAGLIFQAERVDFDGRIISGTARANPVIEATGVFARAAAPGFHPLLATPLDGKFDLVMRGFRDFSPKPWPVLFRELQANGGEFELKSVRIERPDAVIVGSGKLTLNDNGRLQGTINIAVAGIDNIVPLLGLDQLIGQGVDRLTGGSGVPSQGLGTLDRLMPGLGNVVRESASASVVSNIKRMGQPTEIDQKPAIALPLRVADGVVFLGIIPLGVLPTLF